MHGADAEAVVAKRLDRQRLAGPAALRQTSPRPRALVVPWIRVSPPAPNDRDRPALTPRSRRAGPAAACLCMPDAGLGLALAIGIGDASRQGDDIVVRENVAIERIVRDRDRGAPPSLRNARSCSSAQIRTLDCQVSNRTGLPRVVEEHLGLHAVESRKRPCRVRAWPTWNRSGSRGPTPERSRDACCWRPPRSCHSYAFASEPNLRITHRLAQPGWLTQAADPLSPRTRSNHTICWNS